MRDDEREHGVMKSLEPPHGGWGVGVAGCDGTGLGPCGTLPGRVGTHEARTIAPGRTYQVLVNVKWSGLLTHGEETHVFRVRIDPPLVVPSPSASRVPPDVANSALASYARETGRSEVAICLYVDPSTGLDAGAARASLQSSVDTLVRQGYTVLGVKPVVLCPQAPVFIRTSTVHPKNSGSGLPVGTTARVTTPSPILLFVAVTTPSRINFIFGGLTTRRGAEEATCAGDNCREVTGSIYSDPTAFAGAVERERGRATTKGTLARFPR